jgi:DtxR family Mn-dependent transcriptional regulator
VRNGLRCTVLRPYRKAIPIFTPGKGKARMREVTEQMGVKKPSVVDVVRALPEKELVHHKHHGPLELTPKGMVASREIYHRYQAFPRFSHGILMVDECLAERDACQIEHYGNSHELYKLVRFPEFVKNFPEIDQEPEWLGHFKKCLKDKRATTMW